jgi:hypothetical protein
MQLDSKTKSNNLILMFDNPFLFALFLLIPISIFNLILIHKRKKNHIVGYFFEDELKILRLNYRTLNSNELINIEIPYNELNAEAFIETKILFNLPYKGIKIKTKNLELLFISNNFIWEEHTLEKKYFLQRIGKMI